MDHILIDCNKRAVSIIWRKTKELWPHTVFPWPNISLGTILGCGAMSLPCPQDNNNATNRNQNPPKRAAVQLMRILITKAAHLIWSLRCERVIQEKMHSDNEITSRWLQAINKQLNEDKLVVGLHAVTIHNGCTAGLYRRHNRTIQAPKHTANGRTIYRPAP